MSAFLTSLASIGSQAGEAKDEVRQESEARQNKLKEFTQSNAYLDLAKQAEQRQQAEFEQRKKAGDIIVLPDGRIWSVSKGGPIEQPKVDPAQVFKHFFSTNLDPRERELLGPRLQLAAERYPYNQEKMLGEAQSEADKVHAEVEREKAAALAETNRKQDALDRRKELETYQTEERKSREASQLSMAKIMTDYRGQELSPAAQKILMTTSPTLEQVDRLRSDIEKLGLQNNNQNGYLLGPRLKYAMGIESPAGTLGDDIAGLSLGSVIEAGSAMQGMGRSLTLFKKAAVHTPNPWKDSPALMYHKLGEIKQRLQDMENDARKYGTKRGIVGGEQPSADSGAPPPGAVVHDFSH